MKKPVPFLSLLLLLSCFFSACKQDPVGPTDRKTVSGIVVDEFDSPLSGIKVTMHGEQEFTDDNGFFELSNVEVPEKRGVVTASGDGYFTGVQGFVPSSEKEIFVKIKLDRLEVTASLDAATGGVAELPNGAGVEIPASGIRTANGGTYSGTVNVAINHLDPTSADFASLVSGGDLQAQRTDQSEVSLYSYGILRVELRDGAGNELQLGGGATATIRVPVPASMGASAPATIPLWYLDEETGLWMEEGQATRNGNEYVGTVSHFTDWNCDSPEGTGTVKGRIVDCNGEPVPNLRLNIGQGTTTTDINGNFCRRVPANTPFSITSDGGVIEIAPVNVGPIAEGAQTDVGTIQGSCAAVVSAGLTVCGGNAEFPIYVKVSWSGGSTDVWVTSLPFDLPAPPNTEVTIQAWTITGKAGTQTLTTGPVGTPVAIAIDLCEGELITPTQVQINGGPYNQKQLTIVPVVVFSFSTALSTYDISDNETELLVSSGTGALATLSVSGISGKSVGSTDLASNNVSFSLVFGDRINGDSVLVSLSNVISGQLDLSRYGAVGEKVGGNFSLIANGEIFNYTTNTSTPISNVTLNGALETLRAADEP
ncbi:MAG: hypothetical protein EAZ89_16700 [Bacteroidetes bacterium]|nr:MAG: hypothetical protein EAZ89_16700 [Bacteroidota bacterium]